MVKSAKLEVWKLDRYIGQKLKHVKQEQQRR